MPKILGVDLGTANTFIYAKGKGIILRSPSVVAIDKESRDVVAVGIKARQMLGKTPEGISAFRPLKDGVIADLDVTAKMIRKFFEITESISFFSRPVVVVCIPYGVTEVERRAVEDAVSAAGARAVALIEEPLAAAIGAGLSVSGPTGSMIADIGGGTTEIAAMSLGGVVASRSIKTAGDALDASIANYLRSEKGILVGEITAEQIKMKIGSAFPTINAGCEEVYGRELRTGHAISRTVSSEDTREAMRDELEEIIRAIKATLEDTPPELSSDIYDTGIMMTGGGSLLPGLAQCISKTTGIKVTVSKDAINAVAIGIGKVIDAEMNGVVTYRNK